MMQAIPNDVTACICGVMVNKHALSGQVVTNLL